MKTVKMKRLVVPLLLSLLMLSRGLGSIGNFIPQVEAQSSTVYYKEDATYVYIYHPNLEITIYKTRTNFRQGGRITSIKYKGSPNIVGTNPQYGLIKVWDITNSYWRYPDTVSIDSAFGNNTNKLVLSLKTTSLKDSTGGNALNINVTETFTLYSDFNAIFMKVTINSSLNDWYVRTANYATSLKFKPFTAYNATGQQYLAFKTGSLTKSGTKPIPPSEGIYLNILTITNSSNNLRVTLFPTYSAMTGEIRDDSDGSWINLLVSPPRYFDPNRVNIGSYIRNLQYGACWIFHDADEHPYVVTPWLMPNAVPYGIMHSYDELPWDGYNIILPNASAAPIASRLFTWLEQNPKRRVNLKLGLDMIFGGNYTPNENGVDGSWTVHGDKRLANSSQTWKDWLVSIAEKCVGLGMHAYHHDYPWQYEFSTVTNTTWINATWNQLYQDFLTLGLSNQSLVDFIAPGYHLRQETLNIILKYGVKLHHVSFGAHNPPFVAIYKNSEGQTLIQDSFFGSVDTDLKNGKTVSYVVNWLKDNLTNRGYVPLSGHFLTSDSLYNYFNTVFTQIENEFGNDLDYFLASEIANYWYDVLLPLEYTYHTTTIEKNIDDSRLTFKIINAPTAIAEGLVYRGTTPSNYILYAPNVETAGWKFTRLSGFATLTNVIESTNRLSFTVSAPSGTLSTTKVYCGDEGEPTAVYAANGTLTWSYNASTTILTLDVTHASPTRILVYWKFPGDIDGDGDVDADDFYIFAGAYGTSPPSNPECDLDGDGDVDSDDFAIFAGNYGKTEP